MHKNLLNTLRLLVKQPTQLKGNINKQLTLFKDSVAGLPFLASCHKSKLSDYDEKHYFVIPFELGEHKVALHTLRNLPDGVPEVNALPKRRVFHFANEHAEALLTNILSEQAESLVRKQQEGQVSRLELLANDIDKLDTKLTYGMFLIGGLSAFVNPAIGAAIAAKAALPSITGLLNKHGVRPLGEKYTQVALNQHIEEAQDKVLQEFSEADTVKLINPVLSRLYRALETSEQQYDPLLDESFNDVGFGEHEKEEWLELTVEALAHVYEDIIHQPELHQQACLCEEDIRWLNYLFKGYLG
ncbi:hypothetical protein [Pseudoalteromonas luteoviolacea]|uniref:hypothetical protein n=1 Tax=Pseudoalteromonas luteoviolacea TaxID=43657 RepID=UPI001B3847D2|nr:hypothetical protein [Pseudoalteromonas luteoviolacea]MBQ4835638.1 hypothetical protein [Pseudoalteromonas luteoviolacea]